MHTILRKPLYIGNLDINNAFDNTDLDLAEEAGRCFTNNGLARAHIQEHREGTICLRFQAHAQQSQ